VRSQLFAGRRFKSFRKRWLRLCAMQRDCSNCCEDNGSDQKRSSPAKLTYPMFPLLIRNEEVQYHHEREQLQ
jgi:hypothetical protein